MNDEVETKQKHEDVPPTIRYYCVYVKPVLTKNVKTV